MATNKKGGRPPTHWWIAEQVYLLVSETERLNPELHDARRSIKLWIVITKHTRSHYYKIITDTTMTTRIMIQKKLVRYG